MGVIGTDDIVVKALTFDQVKSEVLTRVNDPLGDTYSDRAKELVYEGICALALGDYSRDGYPILAKTETYETEGDNQIQINGSSSVLSNPVLRIVGVVDEQLISAQSDTSPYRFIPIDNAKYNKLHDEDERPFDDEIYYYREGDFLYLYPYGRAAGNVLISYIASPDDYGDDDIMTDGYSLDFLYKVIDYSVGRIREEQAGE
jgi:hypothetical protein